MRELDMDLGSVAGDFGRDLQDRILEGMSIAIEEATEELHREVADLRTQVEQLSAIVDALEQDAP